MRHRVNSHLTETNQWFNSWIGSFLFTWILIDRFSRITQLMDEPQCLLAHRPHEWIAGEMNQLVEQVNCVIHQTIRAPVLWRLVVNPKHDDAHVVNPEQVR